MAKFLCLFALAAIAQVAYSLECYTCDPNTCSQEASKWGKVAGCGKTATNPNIAGACLKEIYTDNNKPVTIRRCIIANKDSNGKLTYDCNKNDRVSSLCEVCDKDFCNSAPAVSFSFVTLMGAIAAFLIPKYFL